MRLRNLLLVAVIAAAAGWGWLFGPHYIDHVRMQDCAAQAAATWAAWNSEQRARGDFTYQASRRGLPDTLGIEVCDFRTEDQDRVVECDWSVDVTIPVIEHTRRLSFHVRKAAAPDGRMRD